MSDSKVLTGECAYREDELESFVLSIPEDKTQSEFFDIICEHLISVGFSVKYSEPILAVVLKADIRVILNVVDLVKIPPRVWFVSDQPQF